MGKSNNEISEHQSLSFPNMKSFLVGDGQKRIHCSDAFTCDGAEGDTLTLTHKDRPEFLIRITVITVTLKPDVPFDNLRADNRERARKEGLSVTETATTTYCMEQPKTSESEDGMLIQIAYAAIENHMAIFSLAWPIDKMSDSAYEYALNDMREMIESLEVRAVGTEWHTDIYDSQANAIAEATTSILKNGYSYGTGSVQKWHNKRDLLSWVFRYLRQIYTCILKFLGNAGEASLAGRLQKVFDGLHSGTIDKAMAQKAGLAFGVLLRQEIGGLHWKTLMDDDGATLCLRYKDLNVVVFPISMIWKRVERGERIDVSELTAGTTNAIERLIREMDKP